MTLYCIVFDLTGDNTGTEAVVYMRFACANDAWDWARGNWRAFGGPASRVKSVTPHVRSQLSKLGGDDDARLPT